MVKIINAYQQPQSSLGDVFAKTAQALFGDTLTPEVKRQQLYKLSSENTAREAYGTDAPQAYANPSDPNLLGRVATNAMLAGMDPRHVAQAGQYVAGNAFGAADPRTVNANAGAGGNYAATVPGFREAQATELQKNAADIAARERMFGATPVEIMTPDGPRYSTRSQAPGQVPLAPESAVRGGYLSHYFGKLGELPPAEQTVLGAAQKDTGVPEMVRLQRERNLSWNAASKYPVGDPRRDELQRQGDELDAYVKRKLAGNQGMTITNKDGTVIQVGGPAGADTVTSRKTGERLRSIGQTRDVIATMNKIIARSPESIGAVGNVARMGQDAASVVSGLTQMLGGENSVLRGVMTAAIDLKAKGIDVPSLSNPDLNSIETLGSYMAYKVAEAIGQSGNGVSDRDVDRVTNMLGDPTSWFSSPEQSKNKLAAIDAFLAREQEQAAALLGVKVPSPLPYDLPGGKDQQRMPGGAPAVGQVDGRAPVPATQPRRYRYNPATGELE